MRWVVAAEFERLIGPQLEGLRRVAVVGGSSADLEIQWLKSVRPDLAIEYFGLGSYGEDAFTFCDLNVALAGQPRAFDLVHCAQVLEHTWNVQQALRNLIGLVKPGGLLWVNCPASCHAHGSPEYFSAGYQPELIVALARACGCTVVHAQRIGSRRSYFYEHTLARWPDRAEYERPILRMTLGRGGRMRAILRWVKYLPGRVAAQSMSAMQTDDVNVATQTLVLLRAA